MVGEMAAHMREHFELEERLLEENGYPDLDQHKKAHFVYQEEMTEVIL